MSFESIEKQFRRVPGKNRGDVVVFALSTCGWCKKTKSLLDQLGVEYRCLDVDQVQGDAKSLVMKELDKWNPSHSFPTVVVNNEKAIVGFREDEIKEALAHGIE